MDLRLGDCRDVLPTLAEASVDAVVTDPPYELGFMGQAWDRAGVAFDPATWDAVRRVLKPGGHLLAFGGPRTFHRMTVAIEDAGFEIRDCLSWLYGQGFPKSLDVSKALDKAAGTDHVALGSRRLTGKARIKGNGNSGYNYDHGELRDVLPITAPATDLAKQWAGWGTALKPAWEPIILARKPLVGTVAANVAAHGTGALNIDGTRLPTSDQDGRSNHVGPYSSARTWSVSTTPGVTSDGSPLGRWPANVAIDEAAAALLGAPARFFYCAKPSTAERGAGNTHPTVKPVALMRWLTRLVTPPDGLVLDPFLGSGTTGLACQAEGFRFLGIELKPAYLAMARDRLALAEAA